MNKCMRTIVLKLLKPGKRKKTILDEALTNYSLAFQYLLDRAREDIDEIFSEYSNAPIRYRSNIILKWITPEISKELNRFGIEPFKDSIKIDFSDTLSSYLKLKAQGSDVDYPIGYVSDELLDKECNKLVAAIDECCESGNMFDRYLNKFNNKYGKVRPIYFCRYSTKRNYSILYDSDSERYFAKIYLMNSKSDYRGRGSSKAFKPLVYIDKNRETYRIAKGKETFLIFPLVFGNWQESFLKKSLENPEMLKTARLIKEKNEYYLSINVEEEIPEVIDIKSYMGICRGIDNEISYSVVDNEGKCLNSGFENIGDNLISDDKIHKLANKLIKTARKYCSQIITEKLIDKGDKLSWTDNEGKVSSPALKCAQYNQLVSILDYKVQYFGLPRPVKVSSLDIFYRCTSCEGTSLSNRYSDKMLICTRCGKTMNIEKSGSMNLARRLIKYSKDKVRIGVEYTPQGIKFINRELEMEYYPANPYNCRDEVKDVIRKIREEFYSNMTQESQKQIFRRKFSSIRKLEECEKKHGDVFSAISIY